MIEAQRQEKERNVPVNVDDRRHGADQYTRLLDVMAGPHGTPPTRTKPVDLLVVFGSASTQLAYDAASLLIQQAVRRAVFSGGFGKDSGSLTRLGITEADFLASIAIAAGAPPDTILIERCASNGAENAARSLQLATKAGILSPDATVAGLAPAARNRRLFEELRYQAAHIQTLVTVTAGIPSGRATVNIADPAVQHELIQEVRGLHRMHATQPARIFRLPDFQRGGEHYGFVQLANCQPDN